MNIDPAYAPATEAELAEEKRLARERAAAEDVGESHEAYHATSPAMVWLAWIAVGIPLAWGVYRTLLSAGKFFN